MEDPTIIKKIYMGHIHFILANNHSGNLVTIMRWWVMRTGMPNYRLSRRGFYKEMVLYTEVIHALAIFETYLLCGICTH